MKSLKVGDIVKCKSRKQLDRLCNKTKEKLEYHGDSIYGISLTNWDELVGIPKKVIYVESDTDSIELEEGGYFNIPQKAVIRVKK